MSEQREQFWFYLGLIAALLFCLLYTGYAQWSAIVPRPTTKER